METTIVYWDNIGIMEKNMETTIAYWGNIGIGQENGNYYSILYWVVREGLGRQSVRVASLQVQGSRSQNV